MFNRKEIFIVVVFIVIVELIGYVSSILAGNISAEYALLIKPTFSPPDWVFGIVWTLLYAMMGFAAFLVFQKNMDVSKKALTYFGIQLVLNFSWSIIFFRFKEFWIAFIVILLIDVIVAYTIYLFSEIQKTSAKLMIPYLIWILFASYLNFAIAVLN